MDIAIWNCTHPDVGWQEMGIVRKMQELRSAVERVSTRCVNARAVQAVFVAPEYALTDKDRGRPIPAEPLPVGLMSKFLDALEKISRRHPRIFIIPGSFTYATQSRLQNRVVGYHGGESVIFVGKQHGVGEVPQHDILQFEPGNGGATVTISGTEFCVQICRDATVNTTMNPAVDIHITVGQGVGLPAIVKQVPRLARVVADPFAPAVQRAGQDAQDPDQQETHREIVISYYTI